MVQIYRNLDQTRQQTDRGRKYDCQPPTTISRLLNLVLLSVARSSNDESNCPQSEHQEEVSRDVKMAVRKQAGQRIIVYLTQKHQRHARNQWQPGG